MTASGFIHASGVSPAFKPRCERYWRTSHPCSIGTCGRSSPLIPWSSSMSPSRPMTMESVISCDPSARILSGTDRMVTSTVTPPTSSALRSGNLGSWHADLPASTIASPRGRTGMGNPMQPRRNPSGKVDRVTNAPDLSTKRESAGMTGATAPAASNITAERARDTASLPKPSVIRRNP